MIVLTVTLVPGGDELRRRDIEMLRISNVSKFSECTVDFIEAANPLIGSRARIGDYLVELHDRVQSVWTLVVRVIASLDTANFVEL